MCLSTKGALVCGLSSLLVNTMNSKCLSINREKYKIVQCKILHWGSVRYLTFLTQFNKQGKMTPCITYLLEKDQKHNCSLRPFGRAVSLLR